MPSTPFYDQVAASVLGIVRRVVRDPAQSEEVTQDVLLEVWRNAAKFDQERGSAIAWVMTLAHRRAVDRVRSVQKESERERRHATADIPYDEVAEAVESSLERERVRRCLGSHRTAARVGHPRLLRRLYLRAGGQPARGAGRHDQDQDAGRARPAAGLHGGGRLSRRQREEHTLAGPYAMDAISAPDRARFERHLAGCQECAREVSSLREATARLATATAVSPPAALKERVMAAAAATRQQPPAAERDPAARSWRIRRGLRVRPAVAAAAAAVAVVAAAAVVFGVSNGSMRDQPDQAQASSQQIAAVLTARDATMMTGAVKGGGTVTIVMSHSRHALVFTAADLRALPASRGYELWLIGPAGDRPVTMLPPGRHDMTGPVIASGLRPGDHLALTAEPAGGTPRPTTAMMLYVVLLNRPVKLSC